ncbi:MAG: HEAT repeat domain-containing protein [Planctomycetota bacterium]|nr:HEAT repeat domain-containing protein [Planctomycetota bacterium]
MKSPFSAGSRFSMAPFHGRLMLFSCKMMPGGFTPLLAVALWMVCWNNTSGQDIAIRIKSRPVSEPQPAPAGEKNEDPNELILKQKGVQPTQDSIRRFLQDIHISAEQKKQAAALISLLGSDDYRVRAEATRKLSRFPGLPIEEFEAAKKNSDMETVYRIEMVARFLNVSFGQTLQAVYQVIVDRKITGLMPEIIRSRPFTLDDEKLTASLLLAIVSTAIPSDEQRLRELLQDESTRVQAAAIEGLYLSRREAVIPLLKTVCSAGDRDDLVRFEAAKALADLGNKSCLEILIGLLESENVNVRTQAGSTLQIVTGMDFGFTGYAKEEMRKPGVTQWKDWYASKSATVELRFPLDKFIEFESYLGGNTLLACGYKNRVVELSPDGEEVWSVNAQGAWAAEKMKNGNVLVACYNQNKVVEYNSEKEIVWTYPCASPLNVRPLKNGNVLVSEYSGRRVVEVNRKKEIIWSYSAGASVADAVRLPTGNTLVAAQTKIVEVDIKGKVVWEYATAQPYGIQALKNGNILISKFTPGQVLEVNRKKEIVWQYDCKNPTDAMMLPNGNVLITENTRFIEVTRQKKVIWTRAGASCGAARR